MGLIDIPYAGPGLKCDTPSCGAHSEVATITKHAWCGEDFCSTCLAEHAVPCEAEDHERGCCCDYCVNRACMAAESLRDAEEDR